ncbi:MAG TPA: YceI family protein [Terracidiphilus sp.]|nr:YceI family protein [Terracidiphilus sp.]
MRTAGAQSTSEAPVYEITPEAGTINFRLTGSIVPGGTFWKWGARLTFTSTDPSSGSLYIKIHAESLDTRNRRDDNRLKQKNGFDVQEHPYVTFQSTEIRQTGPNAFIVSGTLTFRGITKGQSLTLTFDREGDGRSEVDGMLYFDPRTDVVRNPRAPFVIIADRVEITVDIKGRRVSGPALVFKQ